jgi:hypothetical protein
VNLTGAHPKGGGSERNDRIESFGHIARFKKKGHFAHQIRIELKTLRR